MVGILYMPLPAPVAQRTEHRSSEPSVGGSSPSGSASYYHTRTSQGFRAGAPSFFSFRVPLFQYSPFDEESEGRIR